MKSVLHFQSLITKQFYTYILSKTILISMYQQNVCYKISHKYITHLI